jgi:6-phosphogluconolactonase
VHPIDPRTGTLGEPSRRAVDKNPNWIEIVNLP